MILKLAKLPEPHTAPVKSHSKARVPVLKELLPAFEMTAREYKTIRESIGTPTQVAALLGVSRMTIHNRESGKLITEEAAMAITALREARKTARPPIS